MHMLSIKQKRQKERISSNNRNIPKSPNLPNRHYKGKTDTSIISKAHPSVPSVRTTIPHTIVEILSWQAGDVLRWSIVQEDGKYFVMIRRLE